MSRRLVLCTVKRNRFPNTKRNERVPWIVFVYMSTYAVGFRTRNETDVFFFVLRIKILSIYDILNKILKCK